MRLGIYAHPFDLADLEARGGVARLRELGFDDVALAVAYHAGRWFMPWNRGGPVRFLEDGVLHFRPRGDYGALRPVVGSELAASGPSPLEVLVSRAREAGVQSHAWTVVFHNSRLGRAHPQHCVTNAFGDAYTYALCPAQDAPRAYARALVGDLAGHAGLDVVELEAVGFLGHRHGSHHDKSSFASDAYTDFLLSYCFCAACRTGLGAGVAAIQARVIELVREHRLDGDAMAPSPVAELSSEAALERLRADLGGDALDAMLAHRRRVLERVLAELREATRGRTRLSLHMAFDPLFTGSQVGARGELAAGRVDAVVATHYGDAPARILAACDAAPLARVPVHVAVWPKAPQFRGEDDVEALVARLAERGAAGLRVYHLGLLPWRTIERVAGAFRRVAGAQRR